MRGKAGRPACAPSREPFRFLTAQVPAPAVQRPDGYIRYTGVRAVRSTRLAPAVRRDKTAARLRQRRIVARLPARERSKNIQAGRGYRIF